VRERLSGADLWQMAQLLSDPALVFPHLPITLDHTTPMSAPPFMRTMMKTLETNKVAVWEGIIVEKGKTRIRCGRA
jgi:hypothetical protein